jgi:hypothetical protein
MPPNTSPLSQGEGNWLQDAAVRKGSRPARARRRGCRQMQWERERERERETERQRHERDKLDQFQSPTSLLPLSWWGSTQLISNRRRRREPLQWKGIDHEHSNYASVWGKIYLISAVRRRGRGQGLPSGGDSGELVVLESKIAPSMLLLKPESPCPLSRGQETVATRLLDLFSNLGPSESYLWAFGK